jgi:hypothetical protein
MACVEISLPTTSTIGIELEKEYTAIAEKRIMSAQPLFAGLEL